MLCEYRITRGFVQFSNRTGPQFSYYKYIVLCGQHRPNLLFVPTGITAKKLLNCFRQRQSKWMVVQFKTNKIEIEIVRAETFWKNKQERNQACIVIESFREWSCIVCCEDKELTQQLSKLDTTADNSRSTSSRNGPKTGKIYTHTKFYATISPTYTHRNAHGLFSTAQWFISIFSSHAFDLRV
jgi:hypothetical protein